MIINNTNNNNNDLLIINKNVINKYHSIRKND